MEKGQKKKAQHPHHPHHVVPKHESGYTDEVAIEAHDLIDKAEEDAHVSTPHPSCHTTVSCPMRARPGRLCRH